jgi:ABC-2 type transport system ATP-binding protein
VSTSDIALRVDRITRTFANDTGIRDITFEAANRGITAVIGPNGAGKTVLFTILAGLASADSGHVVSQPGARTAYCPDVPEFESWLTAREVVENSTAMCGGTPSRIAPREALALCGLRKVEDRGVANFSRGMLQRLGLAAALVLDPDVLILDEPNSALDPIGRADIRAVLEEQRQHRCILLSSHLLSEVEQLADHVVVMNEGRLISSGTTSQLLTRAADPIWNIRLNTQLTPEGARTSEHMLRAQFPEARIRFTSDAICQVRFSSFEQADTELPRLIAALPAPLVEVTLEDRDLDAAFARLIGDPHP